MLGSFTAGAFLFNRTLRRFTLGFFSLCLIFGVSQTGFAQDDIPDDVAPPPIKTLTKDERNALNAVTDVKDRTKIAIELMESRLKKAEALTTEETYTELLTELGGFQAIMDNAIVYLNRNDNRGGKTMNTFKKFEFALRAFTPRIELIRREIPDRYEYHVRQVLRNLRDTRAKAVEPLFSNTVLPNEN